MWLIGTGIVFTGRMNQATGSGRSGRFQSDAGVQGSRLKCRRRGGGPGVVAFISGWPSWPLTQVRWRGAAVSRDLRF